MTTVLGCGAGSSDTDTFGKDMKAREVITRLKQEGLPVGRVQEFTAKSDPNELLGRPGEYVAKANFTDRRIKGQGLEGEGFQGIETEEGGSVEVFTDQGDADKRVAYVR